MLRDLNELAKEVTKNFNDKFVSTDCKLPQSFKPLLEVLEDYDYLLSL